MEEEETVALPRENDTCSNQMLSQPFLVEDEIDPGSYDEDGDTSYCSIGKFYINICAVQKVKSHFIA